MYESFRLVIGMAFYPITRLVLRRYLTYMGIEIVDHVPKKDNELRINNEWELAKRVSRNIPSGLLDSFVDGVIEGDLPALVTHIRDKDMSILKDTHHYMSQLINTQLGTMSWEVASHYNTGNKNAYRISFYCFDLLNSRIV